MAKFQGITIEIDGNSTGLQKALKDVNKPIKETDYALRQLESLTKIDGGGGIDRWLTKQKLIKKEIQETEAKQKMLNEALAKAEAQGIDKASTGYIELQKEIAQTEKKLKDLNSQTLSATSVGNALGSVLSGSLKFGFEALKTTIIASATAMATLGTAITKITLDASAQADELNTMAKVYGISTEELQKYAYASELIDVDVSTLTGSMTKLTRSMSSAQNGTKASAEAFETLGVAITDSDGNFRDRNVVFTETIKALGEITDETQRDALAMQIFGKSAMELNPLILGGADALEEYGEQAEKFGLILNQDMLDTLNDTQDQFDLFKANLKQSGMILGSQFAPYLTKVGQGLNDFILSLASAFQSGGLSGMITEFVSQIETIMPVVMQSITDGLMAIITYISENSEVFVSKGIELILKLAQGFIQALPQLIANVSVLIRNVISSIANNFPSIVQTGLDLVASLISGIASSIPNIVKIGGDIVRGLWNGIKSASSWLKDRIGEWCSSILSNIKRFFRISSPSKVMADEVGVFMAEGIGVGFDKEIPKVEKEMNNALSDLTANVKTSMNPNVNTKVGNYQFVHQITINTNGNLSQEQIEELSRKIVDDVSIDLGRRVFA